MPIGVKPQLLDFGGVDDVYNVWNRDRGLGDIGRQDDTTNALGRGVENDLLFGKGYRRVEDVDTILFLIAKIERKPAG